MDRNRKIEIVNEIKNGFEKSSFVILYNYSGSNNEDVFKIKKKLKKLNVKWIVFKNNLIKKAIQIKDLKENNASIFIPFKNNERNDDVFLNVLREILDFKSDEENNEQRIHFILNNKKEILNNNFLIKCSKVGDKNAMVSNLIFFLKFAIIKLVKLLIQINKKK